MKKVLLTLGAAALLSTGVYAAEGYNLSLGAGAGYQLSPYQGVGGTTSPIPFMNFEYDKFYMRSGDVRYSVLSIGYDMYENESMTVSAYFNPWGGFNVERSDMDKGYGNIDDREYQAEGGLKVLFDTGLNGLKVQVNTTYGEEGGHAGVSAFKAYPVTDKMVVVPRATITYFNDNYLDYYFGVSEDEAGRNSKIDGKYEAGSGFAFAFDLATNYKLSENLQLIGFVGVEKHSSEVDDSPIVEEDVIYRAGTGINYIF